MLKAVADDESIDAYIAFGSVTLLYCRLCCRQAITTRHEMQTDFALLVVFILLFS